MSVTEFLGGVISRGVKQKSVSGRGQACSKFQHDGGLPNLIYLLGISESTITSLSDQSSTTRAARAAQGCTNDRVRMGPGLVCANDEVAKSRRTGITRAYTQDMLSRERTMDCIMHYWY